MASRWTIKDCASFIVKPSKNSKNSSSPPVVTGSLIKLGNDLQLYFQKTFDSSNFPIQSIFSTKGSQQNYVRSLILDLCNNKTKLEKACYSLASRLASYTDGRSNKVLLVILIGCTPPNYRIVVLTLPSNEMVLATESNGNFQLNLTKEAYSKESNFFKGAMFEGNPNSRNDFWQGRIEDLQAKQYAKGVSDYWLKFLDSKLEITDQRMTRSIMAAAKRAIEKTQDVTDKENILAGIRSAMAQKNTQITADKFIQDYMPPNQKEIIKKYSRLEPEELQQPFTIVPEIVNNEIAIKTVWVDNQFSISGPSSEFDQKVSKKTIGNQEVEFSLRGRITNEKLTRKRRSESTKEL